MIRVHRLDGERLRKAAIPRDEAQEEHIEHEQRDGGLRDVSERMLAQPRQGHRRRGEAMEPVTRGPEGIRSAGFRPSRDQVGNPRGQQPFRDRPDQPLSWRQPFVGQGERKVPDLPIEVWHPDLE